MVIAQCLTAAGFMGVSILHQPGWYGAVTGLVASAIALCPTKKRSMLQRIITRLNFWHGQLFRNSAEAPDRHFDANLPDGSAIGFLRDGESLLSVVRLQGDPRILTIMEPNSTISAQWISVGLLAECLDQFDTPLDSITLLNHGVRSRGRGRTAATYDAVLGPLPAIAHREVCLAIRFDPRRCPAAVSRRGGDWDGVVRTASTATRRVVNRLADEGLRPEILSASDAVQATTDLIDGHNVDHIDETWSTCLSSPARWRSFAFDPTMYDSSRLDRLWTVPSLSTTVCLTVRRDRGTPLIRVRGLARFGETGRRRIELGGLRSLPGEQLPALRCTLPAPAPRRRLGYWVRGKTADAGCGLLLPVSGCGQIIGADMQGRAVALSLFGPGIARVELCGTLHLAQQVVLRSVALGARIRIHSARALAWQDLIAEVGDPEVLCDDEQHELSPSSRDGYSVEVFDGIPVEEKSGPSAATAMIIKPSHALPADHADVMLQLLDHGRDIVRVQTSAGSTDVTMVATSDEMRYIGAAFEMTG
ncbi:type VII secretion protein EccE [Mycobacterium sp. 3519A]|uniref:type VII secretion protein EccE n=1 Tax=Mycobacterium sp. 3519A TaxID=2057184 RepID=UPI0013598900|nr:type VII secretion protein EccE [Mycobacterium sp. 3519A]